MFFHLINTIKATDNLLSLFDAKYPYLQHLYACDILPIGGGVKGSSRSSVITFLIDAILIILIKLVSYTLIYLLL